ncbi:MAG: hypothetical protein LBV50_07930 [Novosphingobium sp.]|jgi:hypothetical protein|nr:hypothetical protein [Novosphingobium sp.]
MVTQAFNAAAGAFGGIIRSTPPLQSRCTREKTAAGWFDPNEITNQNPPLIGELRVTVGGQEIFVRHVVSPEKFNENSKNRRYGQIKEDIYRNIGIKLSEILTKN